MDVEAAITEIAKRMKKPRFRAEHGQWVPYAWIVRGLVERGHPVAESVRNVVAQGKITPVDVAVASIRAAYYKIRLKKWPADMAHHSLPKTKSDEGAFE